MAGERFGRLSVVRRAGNSAAGIATWLCLCDCGNRTVVMGSNLRRGRTKSCGCYGRETGTMNTRHGHSKQYRKSPEYSAWSSLLARCYRPTNDAFLGMAERESRCANVGAAASQPSSPMWVSGRLPISSSYASTKIATTLRQIVSGASNQEASAAPGRLVDTAVAD
jgi:hypothetical protein